MGLVAIAVLALVTVASRDRSRDSHGDAGRRGHVTSLAGVFPADPDSDRGQLATDLDRAQEIIDDPSRPRLQLANAGRFEQLATLDLARQTLRVQRATLATLDGQTAASMRANLEAAAVLTRLVAPRRSLPHWTIVQPPAPNTLLGYFKAAQSRFGVPWEYLAAIEFIETRFGRVAGLSSAGAQGPMQFLPATWARYGNGDIHNPDDAIHAAARYLVANGAPGEMAAALYHYNPSSDYVSAVRDYAGRMRADPRAYYGYYYWQVIYAHPGDPLVLPVGYPKVPPVPVR